MAVASGERSGRERQIGRQVAPIASAVPPPDQSASWLLARGDVTRLLVQRPQPHLAGAPGPDCARGRA